MTSDRTPVDSWTREPGQEELTKLLHSASNGDPDAEEQILPLVYSSLRRLAYQKMRNEPTDHTLQPTALVHEAYLRLIRSPDVQWENRRHFFGAAAEAMRRILVERARRVRREKHGRDVERVPFDDPAVLASACSKQLLALNVALDKLEVDHPRRAEIVKLRYFAGLTIEETADTLSISPATVKLDWSLAKVWLHRETRRIDPDAWNGAVLP
ncbi:MAG: sigma-70 family RNA polymerase sigma factor [Candidatus Eisenbacteria bacterium]|uniref:Sigma-70 family RNA polymerase sigma factor n=1 Tax=Eiseniibacteriota bacterium TaxID=2212470 RepID=A0A956SEG1_UNCEI|nr:sigma-70 family RNA polymerase sigma factor [Candidatus Eisenbacteria bacterium]